MKKWKCTVCGYVHEGEEPPEICPVCGAASDKFVELEEEGKPTEPQTDEDQNTEEAPEPEGEPKEEPSSATDDALKKGPFAALSKFAFVDEMILKHHVHPISVHVPNGVLPISVIFIVLAALFNSTALSQAAFYNLAFVVLSLPLTLYTGYVEWKNKYNAAMTKIFIIKISSAAVVSAFSFILVLWRLIDPHVMDPGSLHIWTYVGLHLILLAAAGIAGFIGGKLVFKEF